MTEVAFVGVGGTRGQVRDGQAAERERGVAGVFGLRHGVKGSDVWQNYTHLSL